MSAIGAVEFESFPGRGAVLPPTEAFTMRWSGDLDLFAVKISTAVVERTVESVLGYPPDEAVRFAVAFDVTSSAGRRWLRSVAMLRDALDEGAPDLVVRPLEELIVGQLLAAQPHNFTDRLEGSPRPARPRVLRRVIECIEADPAAPHTVADLALVAGTSARSLQAAFAEHLGLSPMAYLRRVRLARAHEDLQAAVSGGGQSVADIASVGGSDTSRASPRPTVSATAYRLNRPSAADRSADPATAQNRSREPDRRCVQRIARSW